jgi:hypothetical protein
LKDGVNINEQIERTRNDLDKSYRKALKDVQKLKKKINELELSIIQKGDSESNGGLNELNFTIENLNRITDSQILISGKAWSEYKRLEHDCVKFALKPVILDDFRVLCKKNEELAADLLCYSLAHFKRQHPLT